MCKTWGSFLFIPLSHLASETAEKGSEWVRIGNLATAILSPQFDLIDLKQENFKKLNTLDLSIPLLPLLWSWHARLNSKMPPTQDFPLYSLGLWNWGDILPTIMSIHMVVYNAIKVTNQLPWTRKIIRMPLCNHMSPFKAEFYPAGCRRSQRDSKGERDVMQRKFSIAKWRGHRPGPESSL